MATDQEIQKGRCCTDDQTSCPNCAETPEVHEASGLEAKHSARPREEGFTLLELVAALAIVGLALAVAVPQLTGRSAVELKATAQSVAAALRRTRDQAMSENQSRVMGVDVEARRFQAGAQSAARQMPAHIEVSLYTARSERLSGSAGGIRFFPDGSSTGGQIALSAKGRRYVIDVDWLTGRVRIYEDDESRGDG